MFRRNSDDYSDAPSPRDRDYDYSSTTNSSYRDPYYEQDDRRGGLFHRGGHDSRTVAPEHHGPWTASATSVPPVDMPMGMTGNRSGEPGMLRRGIENLKENVGGNRDRSAYRSYSRDSWERENNRKNKDSRRRDVDLTGRDKSHRSDFYNDNESSSRHGSDFGGMSSGYHGMSSYGGSYHPSYYGHGYDMGHSGYGTQNYGMMGHYGSHYGHPSSYYNSGSHYGYYPHYSSGMGHYTGGHSTGYEGLYFGEIYESRNNSGKGIESLTRGMKRMNVDGRVRPDVDIYGNEQEWIIEMDLPGFVRENIDMKFIGDNLEITATPVQRDSSIKYHVFERSNPTYFRKIHLPAGVDGKRINAVLTNGILRITVPKVDITGTTGLTGTSGTTGTGFSGITTGTSGHGTGNSTTTTTTDSI